VWPILRNSLVTLVFAATMCVAQDVHPPASATAGEGAIIPTTGSGSGTFYLLGPGIAKKSDVRFGEEIHLNAQDLRNAGNYLAIACADACHSASFYVAAAKPANLTFLVHPSRVPVGLSDAVSGVAIPLDQFQNLVLAPVSVNFQLAVGNSPVMSREVRTQDGAAWFRTSSGKSAGTLQVVASVSDLSSRRAVQQVASDPCNLRIKGQRTPKGIMVETDPVRDCSGNPVPDGTIVTFTASDAGGKSTVDAPIKKGVARAQIEASGPAVISAASGIVMGNELHIGGQP
jgi:hypothetical protein